MASWHRARSDMCFFSFFFSRINPCFTGGKRIGDQNCHATRWHRKTTILTFMVYGLDAGPRVTTTKKNVFRRWRDRSFFSPESIGTLLQNFSNRNHVTALHDSTCSRCLHVHSCWPLQLFPSRHVKPYLYHVAGEVCSLNFCCHALNAWRAEGESPIRPRTARQQLTLRLTPEKEVRGGGGGSIWPLGRPEEQNCMWLPKRSHVFFEHSIQLSWLGVFFFSSALPVVRAWIIKNLSLFPKKKKGRLDTLESTRVSFCVTRVTRWRANCPSTMHMAFDLLSNEEYNVDRR